MAVEKKKAPAKKMYFVLGDKASIFWDPVAKLKVLSKDQSAPDEYEGPITKAMALAIGAGHIVKLDAPVPKGEEAKGAEDEDEDEEEGSKALFEGEPTEEKLMGLGEDQLAEYYKDNFDVSKADLKKFKALDKAAKVKFLLEE